MSSKRGNLRMVKLLSVGVLIVLFSAPVMAQEYQEHDSMLMDHGDGHLMDMAGGMVMGQNADTLPGGCDSISETKEITVHAGHKYAEKFPGRMFAFDTQEFKFKPCTKLTVHFVNEDNVRHQWMMHGLPKYLYPKGMFHLEATGPSKISGTLILPPGDKTYLVHCDIAQHMEKGMKAQLKVGEGDGDLPSIPGVTAYVIADDYKATLPELMAKAASDIDSAPAIAVVASPAPKTTVQQDNSVISGVTVIGLALGLLAAPFLARKFKGMSVSEVVAYVFDLLRAFIDLVVNLLARLIKLIATNKNKILPGK
jgi:plastocyanin